MSTREICKGKLQYTNVCYHCSGLSEWKSRGIRYPHYQCQKQITQAPESKNHIESGLSQKLNSRTVVLPHRLSWLLSLMINHRNRSQLDRLLLEVFFDLRPLIGTDGESRHEPTDFIELNGWKWWKHMKTMFAAHAQHFPLHPLQSSPK